MLQVGAVSITAPLVDEVISLIDGAEYDRGYLGIAVCVENVWQARTKLLLELVREYCDALVVSHARLLCMQANAGKFAAHTDSDFGMADGKLIRLHFPIVSHELAIVSCRIGGQWVEHHLKPGSVYYFDPQMPHFIANNSDVNRIHMVVDVDANAETRALIIGEVSE